MGAHVSQLNEWDVEVVFCKTARGTYRIEAMFGRWVLAFYTVGRVRIQIDLYDADGNSHDWPTLADAKQAARAHYARMELGESPHEAAAKLMANLAEVAT